MMRARAKTRRIALIALVGAIGVLAGCGVAPHPSPSATALPSGITATIVPLPADAPVTAADDPEARQAQVEIHNGAESTLRIGEVLVEDPRFDGIARRAVEGDSRIPSGRTVDVRVTLPPLNCDADDEGATIFEAQFAVGASESVARFEIADASGFISELHDVECAPSDSSAG